MRIVGLAILLCLVVVPSADADVLDATTGGFSIKIATSVNAPPAAVFRAISEQIGRWWDPAHTYSGDAANLSIEPRAGGCWCERLPAGGVQHMVVGHINAPNTLVFHGGLGPLGSMGVAGALAWTLTDRSGTTDIQVTYNVGGYVQGGFGPLAPLVDAVLSAQVKRLKAFVETGRPE
jgi:uncharacterized protein YndB with AHSA1/START domain